MHNLYEEGKLLLSSNFLKAKLGESVINRWTERDKPYTKKNNLRYFNYDDIPAPSQSKLPSKINLIAECRIEETNQQVEAYVKKITFLVTQGCIKYKNEYKEKYKISHENALKAGQLKAFWQWVIDEGIKDTGNLFEAFNKVMPGKYKSYNVFNNVKSKAVNEGVEKAAFDKRWIEAQKNIKRTSDVTMYWIREIGAIPKNIKLLLFLKKSLRYAKKLK